MIYSVLIQPYENQLPYYDRCCNHVLCLSVIDIIFFIKYILRCSNTKWPPSKVTQYIKSTKNHDDIIKSPEDKRRYCVLELNNGMKIFLISDPLTDKSAVSMNVNIGMTRYTKLDFMSEDVFLSSLFPVIVSILNFDFLFFRKDCFACYFYIDYFQ